MARSTASVNIHRRVETSYSLQETHPHRRVPLPQGGADVGKPRWLCYWKWDGRAEELLETHLG